VPDQYSTIQAGIDVAIEGDTVLVSSGTYSPSTNGESFPILMKSNINLIGQGEVETIIDANSTSRVIKMINCQNNFISDLTIKGGIAEGEDIDSWGGGILCYLSSLLLTSVTLSGNKSESGGGISIQNSSVTLVDVSIKDNTALWDGGGICCLYSNPTLENVLIAQNTAVYGGGIDIDSSSPSLTNVTIMNNSATWGGGVLLWTANPLFQNVIVSNNTADSKGGGISVQSNSALMAGKLLMSDNYSVGHGGGIFISAGCEINLQNATVSNNTVGPGDVFGAGIYADGGNAVLINSIIYYNRRMDDAGINYNLNGYSQNIFLEYDIIYSDVEGDTDWVPEGEGNISVNPAFVNSEYGNYTLQEGSPCIDSGTVDSNGDGVEDIIEFYGENPDMGIFEYGGTVLSGDLNGDGILNIQDIILIVNMVLSSNYSTVADMNGDGAVNILDIVLVAFIILNPEP